MFNRIMYVTVFVSDQDKALDFYTNNFGFQKHADYTGPEGRFLTIALKDQGFELLLWLGSAGQAKGTPGLGTLFIESDDLRKDFDELKARGRKLGEAELAELDAIWDQIKNQERSSRRDSLNHKS